MWILVSGEERLLTRTRRISQFMILVLIIETISHALLLIVWERETGTSFISRFSVKKNQASLNSCKHKIIYFSSSIYQVWVTRNCWFCYHWRWRSIGVGLWCWMWSSVWCVLDGQWRVYWGGGRSGNPRNCSYWWCWQLLLDHLNSEHCIQSFLAEEWEPLHQLHHHQQWCWWLRLYFNISQCWV